MDTLSKPRELIESVDQVSQLSVSDLPRRIEPGNVLMCAPTYFTVKDAKNPFMEGKAGTVDAELAKTQWQLLKATFNKLGCEVKIVEPQEDLEDMVFAANQVLPGLEEAGKPFVLLAEMRHEQRRKEVPWYRKWFLANGYQVIMLGDALPDGADVPRFEGQGDAVWHPGRRFLWGGYGARTDVAAYPLVSELLKIPVALLKLADPRFYHLDTCFCALDEDTVMIYEPAFDACGIKLIKHFFKDVVSVSQKDALNFALNALAIEGNVILQKGSPATLDALKSRGFNPIEVDTSEFMKSGGSVFCLKMMIY